MRLHDSDRNGDDVRQDDCKIIIALTQAIRDMPGTMLSVATFTNTLNNDSQQWQRQFDWEDKLVNGSPISSTVRNCVRRIYLTL